MVAGNYHQRIHMYMLIAALLELGQNSFQIRRILLFNGTNDSGKVHLVENLLQLDIGIAMCLIVITRCAMAHKDNTLVVCERGYLRGDGRSG